MTVTSSKTLKIFSRILQKRRFYRNEFKAYKKHNILHFIETKVLKDNIAQGLKIPYLKTLYINVILTFFSQPTLPLLTKSKKLETL